MILFLVRNFFHLPENGACDGIHTFGIRCFEHPEFGLAKFTTEACDSVIVGVHDLNKISNIKIYPNPSLNRLHVVIDGPKPKYWEIRDVTGSLVLSSNRNMALDQQIEIDISQLEKSMYTLVIMDEQNKLVVEKFIKM